MSLDVHGPPFGDTLKSTASSPHTLTDILPIDKFLIWLLEQFAGRLDDSQLVNGGHSFHYILCQVTLFILVPGIFPLGVSADDVVSITIPKIFWVTVDDTRNFGPLCSVGLNKVTELGILLAGPSTTSNEVVELLSGDIDDFLSVSVRACCKDACPKGGMLITSGCTSRSMDHSIQFMLHHVALDTVTLNCLCDTTKFLIAESSLGEASHSVASSGCWIAI